MMEPVLYQNESHSTTRQSWKTCVLKGMISIGFVIGIVSFILFMYHWFSMPNTIVVEAHEIVVKWPWKRVDKEFTTKKEYGPHHAGYEPKACWTLPIGDLGMKLNTHVETIGGKDRCVYDNNQNKKESWSNYQSAWNKLSLKKVFETLWNYGKVLTEQILNFQGDHKEIKTKPSSPFDARRLPEPQTPSAALYSRKESISSSKQLVLNQNMQREKLPLLRDGIHWATVSLKNKYQFNKNFNYMEDNEEVMMHLLPSKHPEAKNVEDATAHYMFSVKDIKMTGLSYERLKVKHQDAAFHDGKFMVPLTLSNITITGKLVKYPLLFDRPFDKSRGVETSFWLKMDGLSNEIQMSHRYHSPSPSSVTLTATKPWNADKVQLFYTQHHRIPSIVFKLYLNPLRRVFSVLLQNHIERTLQQDVLKSLSAYYSQQFYLFRFHWLKYYLISPEERKNEQIIQDSWMKTMMKDYNKQVATNAILHFKPHLSKTALPPQFLNSTLTFQDCQIDMRTVHFQIRGPLLNDKLHHDDTISLFADTIVPLSCNLSHVGNHYFPSSSIWRSQKVNVSSSIGMFLEINVPKKVIYGQHFADPMVDFQFHYYPKSLDIKPESSFLAQASNFNPSIRPWILAMIHKKLRVLLQSRLLVDLRHTIYTLYFKP